jgi:hypothetical protein
MSARGSSEVSWAPAVRIGPVAPGLEGSAGVTYRTAYTASGGLAGDRRPWRATRAFRIAWRGLDGVWTACGADPRHDVVADGLGQSIPGVDDLLQGGVDRPHLR